MSLGQVLIQVHMINGQRLHINMHPWGCSWMVQTTINLFWHIPIYQYDHVPRGCLHILFQPSLLHPGILLGGQLAWWGLQNVEPPLSSWGQRTPSSWSSGGPQVIEAACAVDPGGLWTLTENASSSSATIGSSTCSSIYSRIILFLASSLGTLRVSLRPETRGSPLSVEDTE